MVGRRPRHSREAPRRCDMLSAHERETLRGIRREFLPERSVALPFLSMQGRSPSDRRRPAYTTAALVTTALFVLMLVGPNVLSEKEILARMTPSPRRSWAAPGSLNELTDLDHDPWAQAQVLHEPDEFGGHHVQRLLATPKRHAATA